MPCGWLVLVSTPVNEMYGLEYVAPWKANVGVFGSVSIDDE